MAAADVPVLPTGPGSPEPGQDHFLAVQGARLRYREAGAGPAVVLIHGWTLDLDMWDAQAAALADEFRVIRFDRRGFGLSSGRPSLAADADDAQALCRHLGVSRATFVGMSQAARVVVRIASAAPGLAVRIVLDAAPASLAPQVGPAQAELPLDEYRDLARRHGVEAFRRVWARHPMARLHTADRSAHDRLARMLARYPGHDLLEAPAAAGFDEAGALASIRCPALVLSGALDVASRRSAARQIARTLAAAEYETVPDAGHLAGLDNPSAYNAALRRFLQSHPIA
jgi:3-oxoadipate enol-lactonase